MKKKNGILFRIIREVAFWLLIAVFALQIFLAALVGTDDSETGSRFPIMIMEIISDSMSPKLKTGDGIIQIRAGLGDIKPGDIITIMQDGEYVTHEVVEVTEDSVTTRGLMNPGNDAPVTESEIIGRVILILPGFSAFLSMTYGPVRKLIWIAAILLVLFGPEIIFGLSEKRRRKAQERRKSGKAAVTGTGSAEAAEELKNSKDESEDALQNGSGKTETELTGSSVRAEKNLQDGRNESEEDPEDN